MNGLKIQLIFCNLCLYSLQLSTIYLLFVYFFYIYLSFYLERKHTHSFTIILCFYCSYIFIIYNFIYYTCNHDDQHGVRTHVPLFNRQTHSHCAICAFPLRVAETQYEECVPTTSRQPSFRVVIQYSKVMGDITSYLSLVISWVPRHELDTKNIDS